MEDRKMKKQMCQTRIVRQSIMKNMIDIFDRNKKSEPIANRHKVRIFVVWCTRRDLNSHVIDTRS